MERTIPARNSNETPRIPVGAHSNELSRARPRVTSASSKARGGKDDVATSVARIATRCPSRSRHRAGVLIKSKRPCAISAGLSTGGLVSSVPNTGAYIRAARDKAAIRCGLRNGDLTCVMHRVHSRNYEWSSTSELDTMTDMINKPREKY